MPTDPIPTAAKVINDTNWASDFENHRAATSAEIAEALLCADLLVTPEHDAQVAAKALSDLLMTVPQHAQSIPVDAVRRLIDRIAGGGGRG